MAPKVNEAASRTTVQHTAVIMWNLFVVLFQSLMLQIAANLLEQEAAEIIITKEAYLAENCAALDLSRDQAALMVRTSTSLLHDGLFI